jgi:D-3-phosphoglycerate dehydrogenase
LSNSRRSRVLIATSTFGVADATPLDMLRDSGIDALTNPYGRKLARSEVTQLLAEDVVGLIAGLEPLDREILAASHLKVISRVGVGMSNVDLEAARELGILVYSTPDAPTNAVAELTVGALLSLLRDIPAMDRSVHDGGWEKRLGVEVGSRTVAIIGFGRIGQRLAELLTPFGPTIIGVDPRFDETSAGYPILPLDEALRRADVVSVHVSGDECTAASCSTPHGAAS